MVKFYYYRALRIQNGYFKSINSNEFNEIESLQKKNSI
jgi:hypothetical protein